MIIQGKKISGYSYIGNPSLGTIANPLFWFDYRKGIETVLFSSTRRVRALNDLSNNDFNVFQTTNSNAPVLYTDSLGGIGTNGSGCQLNMPTISPKLKVLHTGVPYFIAFVAAYNNPTDASATGTYAARTGVASSLPGMFFAILAGTNQIQHLFRNDSGTNIGSHNSGNNTVPEDTTYRLFTFTYYGSGESDNSVITIANNSYTTTRNPTFGTGQNDVLRIFRFGVQDITRYKLLISYDLTGKTVSEIDSFRTSFFNTIKSDSEYSGLTTP
jgi:hypothetical protein